MNSVSPKRAITTLLAACIGVAACRDQDRAPASTDTSAGVLDSAPATVATGVVTLLSDENIFAVLDTAYAVMLQTEQLAQEKATDPRVKDFAGRSLTQHTVARRQTAALAERLDVAPVLPDRDVLKGHGEAMAELRAKTGSEFDQAFVERAIEARKAILDEVDDGLEGARQQSVRTFLRQLRSTLEADLKAAEALRGAIG